MSPDTPGGIDVGPLSAWLSAHVPGFEGPVSLEKFEGGQSNPTYRLVTPRRAYVMRSKPGPAALLLPSAHAIEREFRVMQALAGTEVPVPRMLALCEDESIIGRAFYVMEHLPGRVLWDQSLPDMTPGERGAIYDEMNRVLAALHTVDFAACGLADYGRPGNYFERQIGRWSRQYLASVTDPMPEMDRLIDWLPAHLPAGAKDDSRVSIVHGDYRLDNLMFHPSEPRVIGLLDWELSTLGHPLADFSYHCMAWHITPGAFRGIGGLDLAALGIPDEAGYIRRWCERTGLYAPDDLATDWNFYLAYNLFRMAAILQGVARRAQEGMGASANAAQAGASARGLATLAWDFAQRA